jgi:hypothetical protein
MLIISRPAPAFRHRFATLAASLVAVHLIAAAPGSAQAQGAAPAAASEADTKRAVELFKKGQALEKAKKCSEALPIFRESYALVASPNSRIYIARCLAATGDHVAAYLEFEAVIADIDARADPKYQPTRDAAVTERDEAAGKISIVTVNVANATPDTKVSVGMKDIPSDQWGKPIAMQPGTVDVTLTKPPAPPQTQNLELTAGQRKAINLDASGTTTGGGDPTPPPTGSKPKFLRPLSYALAGVGVVGMGMFAVGGALASSTFSDLDNKCSKGTGTRSCPSTTQSQIDEGKVQKDIANVGLIIGAVGLATGVTLFIVSRDSSKKEEPKTEVQAVVGPSYLGVQGSF